MRPLVLLPLTLLACPNDKTDTAGPDTTPPEVYFIRPLPEEAVVGPIDIRVGAEDARGVKDVEFRIYDDVLGIDDSAPFATNWDTSLSLNGTWRLIAIARDDAGNEGQTEMEISVANVTGADPESVHVVSPEDRTTVCGVVTVEAVAGSAVTFSLDGTKVAADEAAPYTWDWDTSTSGNGAHRVIATVDELNTASIRLIERLGFRCEAHFIENDWFKGRWSSEYRYAMLEQEWLERSKVQTLEGLPHNQEAKHESKRLLTNLAAGKPQPRRALPGPA